MGKIISLVNQKGGVGKTTTSINLSASLALLGKDVLLIDLDPQGNATTGVGINKGDIEKSIYDLLRGTCETVEVIRKTDFKKLDIIPATIQLAGIDIELIEKSRSDPNFRRSHQLKEKLQSIKDKYDYIIIDCPPSLGMITTNALSASNSVIIPVQCEFYALEGITQLLNTIMLAQKNLNPKLDLEGVIEEIRSYFKDKVYDTIIPRLIRLAEAPSHGKPIVAYDPKSKGSEAYINLAKEVIMRNGNS